jgi:DNA polymerase (family 10)
MPVSNADIARVFARYATLLEIQGANPFRVRAYRNAAQVLQDLPRSAADMLAAGQDLTELQGIGDDLAGKIAEIVATGRLRKLDELERSMPPALVELTTLPGLGPKRVKLLHETLKTRTLEDLERAARAGRVRDIAGFGPKTEQKILAAIAQRRGREARLAWIEAEQVAEPLLRALRSAPGVRDAAVAGSFRRRRETVGDLDIVVASDAAATVMRRFVTYEDVAEVVASGPTRATIRLRNGLQVDLRVVQEASYGAALQYFTGSKGHNIALRARAARSGLKLSEYGLFKGRRRVAGRTEQEVYLALRLPYIEPELREDRGEIAAAERGALPKLVELGDLRGDLHCHTSATDGRDTLEAMATRAQELGYEYLAITDHTRRLRVAKGLDRRRLARQLVQIERLNAKLGRPRLLKSAEVDILEDGSLDLPDDLLRELDIVVCAVHYKFELTRKQQTDRLIRAMDSRYCHILAHPTGRLLGEREPYAVDMERLMKAARSRGCFLEINAQPQRLDLNEADCRMAKDLGLKLVISTDAHSTTQLEYMRLGIAQARRGWLEAADVVNARRWDEVAELLRRA